MAPRLDLYVLCHTFRLILNIKWIQLCWFLSLCHDDSPQRAQWFMSAWTQFCFCTQIIMIYEALNFTAIGLINGNFVLGKQWMVTINMTQFPVTVFKINLKEIDCVTANFPLIKIICRNFPEWGGNKQTSDWCFNDCMSQWFMCSLLLFVGNDPFPSSAVCWSPLPLLAC